MTTTKRPEQAIIDWILHETGYEVWHNEPLGVLSASSRSLRVYHTPQMQAVVADIVERFVVSEAETHTFSLRVATIDSPDWRIAAHRTLRPIPAQTPGVCAWLMSKEEAAVLLNTLQRRSDYRSHTSNDLHVNNGQTTAISALRAALYSRRESAARRLAGLREPVRHDRRRLFLGVPAADVGRPPLGRCDVQVPDRSGGKAVAGDVGSAHADLASAAGPRGSAPDVEFPFRRRFRWPTDQVLVLSLGVVALPVPVDSTPTLAGLPLPLPSSPPRADLLVIVEGKGPLAETPGAVQATAPGQLQRQ